MRFRGLLGRGLLSFKLAGKLTENVGITRFNPLQMLPHCMQLGPEQPVLIVTPAGKVVLCSQAVIIAMHDVPCIFEIFYMLDSFGHCQHSIRSKRCNLTHTLCEDFPFA